jgi:sugar lactone lactonase YvrE
MGRGKDGLGFTVANGLGWSPDNKHMYFTDTVRRTIYVYGTTYGPEFDIQAPPFITLDASDGTDGLTVDDEAVCRSRYYGTRGGCRVILRKDANCCVSGCRFASTSCCFWGREPRHLVATAPRSEARQTALTAAPQSKFSLRFRSPA